MASRWERRLAKWDASNQVTMEKHREVAGGSWEEFNERNFPGPAWAYAVSFLPVVGWVGTLAIAWAKWRRRQSP